MGSGATELLRTTQSRLGCASKVLLVFSMGVPSSLLIMRSCP